MVLVVSGTSKTYFAIGTSELNLFAFILSKECNLQTVYIPLEEGSGSRFESALRQNPDIVIGITSVLNVSAEDQSIVFSTEHAWTIQRDASGSWWDIDTGKHSKKQGFTDLGYV